MSRITSLAESFGQWIVSVLREAFQLCVTLFKIMVPVLIVVKLLEELGAIDLLTQLVEPAMALVGLPQEMGLVLATTMLTTIYGGMLIFFMVIPDVTMTVAQVTVLGSIMLIAHALPIEVRIAQKAGVRPMFTLALRVLGAFVLGWLLNQFYLAADLLQQPVELLWQPEAVDPTLFGWVITQVKSLGMIAVVVTLLIALLRILKLIGIERLLIWLLQPLMRLMGMGKEATTIVIVGMTLGLAFGAGLLIKEARSGHISDKDLFSSLSLLALCHSIIEDTLLVVLLGADLSGVLWGRLFFAIALVVVMSRLYSRMGSRIQQRYLILARDNG